LANDYSQNISSQHIDEAAENLIRRRDLHIDYLLKYLSEPRSKRFIYPILSASDEDLVKQNQEHGILLLDEDYRFCLELGLLKKDRRLRPANPIYACSIVRYLNENIQYPLSCELIDKWMDGQNIDFTGLLKGFQDFLSLNSKDYFKDQNYIDLSPHLLLSAFIQKVVNDRAIVINDLAKGYGYSEIVVRYSEHSYLIGLEVKYKQNNWQQPSQLLLAYKDRLQTDEGWLVVFDRISRKSLEEKLTWNTETFPRGQTIHVVGC
jgi:hypothetical protein